MNYTIDENFDFYSELNQVLQTKDEKLDSNPICMISHEPLSYNSITLSCKHSFNYLPLYNELCLHNNKQYIICPYCRAKADKLIPFIPLPKVTKIVGVNYPIKWCMPTLKCSFLSKNGPYKGLECEQPGIEHQHGIFCHKHVKYNIDNAWTAEKEQLFKTKSVIDLKAMLKEKGLRVGGVKKELVNRWVNN